MKMVFVPFAATECGWIELVAVFEGGLPHYLYHVPLPQLMLNLKDFINSKTTPKEKANGLDRSKLQAVPSSNR